MPTMDCDAHGWNFEPGDTCPVCDGIVLERERIIALLEAQLPEVVEDAFDEIIGIQEAIALIGGQQANPHYELPEDLQEALDRITIRKKPE